MDAANQQAHDNTMILLRGVLSGGRDDLVEMFEKHADWHNDTAWIPVETAADLVLDLRAGESESHDLGCLSGEPCTAEKACVECRRGD